MNDRDDTGFEIISKPDAQMQNTPPLGHLSAHHSDYL